jgi:hypothetical protein
MGGHVCHEAGSAQLDRGGLCRDVCLMLPVRTTFQDLKLLGCNGRIYSWIYMSLVKKEAIVLCHIHIALQHGVLQGSMRFNLE